MRATWLADVLRDAGLEVIEHAGWKYHDTGGTWSPSFGVVHATAAPRAQADSVQVDVVRNGRAGLPGPIANCVVTRDGRWHVVAAGRCNTTLPGTAGPFKGQGNTYALGVEGCNDNRAEPWPDEQYRSYVRGWAAICRRLGWTAARLVGHREHTPGHKTDPTFDMDRFRADVAAVLVGEDDDMPLSETDLDRIAEAVWTRPHGTKLTENRWPGAGRKPMESWAVLGAVGAKDAGRAVAVLAGKDQVDEQELAAALLPLLAGDQLEAVIRRGMTPEDRLALAARLAV